MENLNGKSKEKLMSLDEFKSIVQSLIKQEKAETRKEYKSGHFNEFENIDELIEEDQKMWELVNTDWEKAQDEIKEFSRNIPSEKKSRRIFSEYLCNLVMRQMYKSLRDKKQ